MITMYKSYIQLYFDYNNIFLENTHIRLWTRLENLQRRCLKCCLPEKRQVGRNEIHIHTGVNTLRDRAESHLLKLIKNQSYLDKNNLILTIRRIAPALLTPFPHIETTKKILIYRGSELWDNLPTEIRNIKTFEAFKTH